MNEKQKRKNRNKSLQEFSTVDIGETCYLGNCCREVRLGATPSKVNDILCGFNTLSDSYEEWKVLSVNETDQWKNIVRRMK